jgi:hypothetical protein
MSAHPAWMIVMLGAALVVVGLAWMIAPSIPWLGRLPGDIRIETEHTRFYFPLTTCILISVALSAAVAIARWLSAR